MKSRVPLALISLSMLLWACIPARASATPPFAATQAAALTPSASQPTRSPTAVALCAFAWATRDLPELSQRLAKDLESIDPAASGNAYAYGEECIAADGTRTFTAMETDFQIQIAVRDLSDKDNLGNWIAKAMAVIAELPASEFQGPRPGRAEFEFRAPNGDTRRLTVDLEGYEVKSDGLSGARLFDALNTAP